MTYDPSDDNDDGTIEAPINLEGDTLSDSTGPIQLGSTVDVNANDVTNVGALSTDRPVITILAGEDAQSIIESANSDTRFIVEPGATFDITPPFTPPSECVIDAGVPGFAFAADHTVFRKAGDGDLMSVPDQFAARGITFDGNRSSYTGDGLVSAEWNQTGTVLQDCQIINVDGHARVHDAPGFVRYENLRVTNCGGFGIRNISTNGDGFRHSELRQVRISDCAGGILAESPDRNNDYNVRLTNLNGPAIEIDTGGDAVIEMRVTGSIRANDGPAIYQRSGRMSDWQIAARFESNAESVSVPTTSPVGAHIHVEGGSDVSRININGGRFGSIGAGASELISDQSTAQTRVSISGGSSTSQAGVAGNLLVANMVPYTFSGADGSNFNGTDGYSIHTHFPGEGYIQSLSGGQKWYFGYFANPPDDPGDNGSLYLDSGGSTADGEPSWRIWQGGPSGSWSDLS